MNKLIVVTGGTKGIGRAIIDLFADKGFDVITCARSEADLQVLKAEVEKQYPSINFQVHHCDLSDKQEVMRFVSFVQTHSSGIEVLVNNAGLFIPGEIQSEADGVLEKMLDLNVLSVYNLTRGLLPEIINSSGHIFNMCSVASLMPYENGGSYCISKYALLGLTKVLREEMKEKEVRVTAVMPGATYTASWEGSDLPEGRFMSAEDVAHAVWGGYAMSPRSVVEEIVIRPQLGDI